MRYITQTEAKASIPFLKMGVYGQAGGGKTTLISGFNNDPRTGPTLWLDVGGNPLMLLRQGTLSFVMSLETAEDLMNPLDFLLTGQPSTHRFFREKLGKDGPTVGDLIPGEKFKSVAVDTFSDWQGLLGDTLAGIKSNSLGSYKLMDIKPLEAKKHGQDMGAKTLFAARQLLMALPALGELPLHVFLTFQEYEDVAFEGSGGAITGGEMKRKISLWGQSRSRIPAWLNLMGRMYWTKKSITETVDIGGGKTKERPTVVPAPKILFKDADGQAKNQVSFSLGDELLEPTAKKILDLIEQDYKGENN